MSKADLISLPSQNFVSPGDILSCEFLSSEEKEQTLLNWKFFCEELQESSNEGMAKSGGEKLSIVVKAFIKLRSENKLSKSF